MNLFDELDGPTDPDAEQAWRDEIVRRSREIELGSVEVVPADEVFERARGDLKQ